MKVRWTDQGVRMAHAAMVSGFTPTGDTREEKMQSLYEHLATVDIEPLREMYPEVDEIQQAAIEETS